MSEISKIEFEYVPPGSQYAMSDGSPYWAFSIYVKNSLEGAGSAETLEKAMEMAKEIIPDIENWPPKENL